MQSPTTHLSGYNLNISATVHDRRLFQRRNELTEGEACSYFELGNDLFGKLRMTERARAGIF
jgi:hypothetical protein